ncbi:hypothetical protein [Butyrivibrio sp.]|uniref:hypothetical protein n=1 Tax=Butyrivibrio sp. TaxID=28121 RepID=UPI0025BD805E|nr:hypothetical protein [Butyrivibrio sp.]MBQ7431260.1 hypothetical protein [Butyrivibrio sp.]MBQ9303475.1 hypothetical protein [Butyrivibrio sp.]
MYIEHIKELLDHCNDSDCERVAECLNKMTDYINRIVQEGPMLMMMSARLEQQDYIVYAQNIYASRNRIHDIACEASNTLNNICKEKHLPPLFPDFTLEKANDPTGTVIYNGETHRKVNEYAAILNNEFYHESTFALEHLLMDQVAKTDLPYTLMDTSTIKETADRYVAEHMQQSIQDVLDMATADEAYITFQDGTVLSVWTGEPCSIGMNDQMNGHLFNADCFIAVKEFNNMTLGEATALFDKDGTGYDVVISALEPLVSLHGGIKQTQNVDHSLSRQVCTRDLIKVADGYRTTPEGTEIAIGDYSLRISDQQQTLSLYHGQCPITKEEFLQNNPKDITSQTAFMNIFNNKDIHLIEPEVMLR